MSSLSEGRRVRVTAYAESPDQALAECMLLEAQPSPDPAALKPNEVLVRIRSAAVAWVDLLMTSGQYQHMAPTPYTPGMEYAGDVVAVGSAVGPRQCRVNDRVLVDFMKVGPRSYGDYQGAGGFATYAIIPADTILQVPDNLSYDEAATLLQAYETAYHCLVVRGQLQQGESVLINGASGLTGLAAVQMAKMLGATVIATGRTAAKLAVVKEHGADHVVVTKNPDGSLKLFRDQVKQLTGGQGVDVVYDAVGGETSLESLRCTAFGARFLIVGWTSTPDVARGRGQRGAPNANLLPTNLIQMKSLSVLGCPSAISAARDPAMRASRLATILAWAGEGKIRPYVSNTYTLDDYKDAMLARWRGEVAGGCVLHP